MEEPNREALISEEDTDKETERFSVRVEEGTTISLPFSIVMEEEEGDIVSSRSLRMMNIAAAFGFSIGWQVIVDGDESSDEIREMTASDPLPF